MLRDTEVGVGRRWGGCSERPSKPQSSSKAVHWDAESKENEKGAGWGRGVVYFYKKRGEEYSGSN